MNIVYPNIQHLIKTESVIRTPIILQVRIPNINNKIKSISQMDKHISTWKKKHKLLSYFTAP